MILRNGFDDVFLVFAPDRGKNKETRWILVEKARLGPKHFLFRHDCFSGREQLQEVSCVWWKVRVGDILFVCCVAGVNGVNFSKWTIKSSKIGFPLSIVHFRSSFDLVPIAEFRMKMHPASFQLHEHSSRSCPYRSSWWLHLQLQDAIVESRRGVSGLHCNWSSELSSIRLR